MVNTDFVYYELMHREKSEFVAGADESGRGPLAGPVVAAAVILPQENFIQGINDSKKVAEKKRDMLYNQIIDQAIDWSVGIVDVPVIEKVNILNAARLAFKKAIQGLHTKNFVLYTDYITGLDIDMEYQAIVKGDAAIYSVAAASILAKVTRDRLMREYDALYPQYGFAKHKGYGTQAHIEAIQAYGPCGIHRMSFLSKIPK